MFTTPHHYWLLTLDYMAIQKQTAPSHEVRCSLWWSASRSGALAAPPSHAQPSLREQVHTIDTCIV